MYLLKVIDMMANSKVNKTGKRTTQERKFVTSKSRIKNLGSSIVP